jgi:hypothetical protein
MSVYCCEECDVGLCMEDCFEAYHTKLNYWRTEGRQQESDFQYTR